MLDMVPGSAKGGSYISDPSLEYYPGVSNSGVGGWHQVGCLIYEVITTRYRPQISENNNTWPYLSKKNWDYYTANWPKLAGVYYDNGAMYCPAGNTNIKDAAYCVAFPCPLNGATSLQSQMNQFIQGGLQ